MLKFGLANFLIAYIIHSVYEFSKPQTFLKYKGGKGILIFKIP